MLTYKIQNYPSLPTEFLCSTILHKKCPFVKITAVLWILTLNEINQLPTGGLNLNIKCINLAPTKSVMGINENQI